jgi:hypothetical protein
MKRWILAAALAAFAMPVFAAADRVEMKDIPDAAQETIRREVGQNKPISLKRKSERNQAVYKVEWEEVDGTNYEMKVRQDGKILEKDSDIF